MGEFAGGKKPGAGRKGYQHELLVTKVLKSATNIVLNTLEGKGRYADIPLEVVVEIATRIYVKRMPTKVEGEMRHVVAMERVKINGAPMEIEIG